MSFVTDVLAKNPKRRILIGSLVFAGLVALIGFGLLLSNTYGAAQVANNARHLHWTNATTGTAALARASVGQAVFFSYEAVSTAETKAKAIGEAYRNLTEVESAIGDEHSTPQIDSALEAYLGAARRTVANAEGGAISEAELERTTSNEVLFEDLVTVLESRQAELTDIIEASDEVSGRISRITFVAMAFMLPAATMIVFWFALRRRMRSREEEMAAQVETERELNKAKDELIAGLSHELRTPLTTIAGFSDILFEDGSIEGEAHELIGLISASSADLTRMVNDLLTAARLDADALSTRLGRVDLAEEIQTVVEPYLRSGESLEVRVPAVEVYSDPLHVRQIAANLISNALRHGGEEVVVSATRNGGKVKLVVADNGQGVPDAMRAQLFMRFANKGREALVAGSVGLGLAISHELAKNVGGSLRYQRVDGWTTFTLSLPVLLSKSDLWGEIGKPAAMGAAPS